MYARKGQQQGLECGMCEVNAQLHKMTSTYVTVG